MKKIIYISLLIITISKINIIEYGKEIPFDKDNNEFELTFKESGALLVSVTFGVPDILQLNMSFKGSEYKDKVTPPGIASIMLYGPDFTNKIKLEYLSPSNEKGTIWLQPTTEEVKIKLYQTYEWKYNLNINLIQIRDFQLIYSIDKSEKDAILEFKYDNNFKIEDNVMASNPSKICHGTICLNGITNYNITKGESYKIYIALNYIKKTIPLGPPLGLYYLPSFSFHFIYEEKEEEKEKLTEQSNKKGETENSIISSHKLNIILIITNILSLIILIVLCILLWRKKDESNIENNPNEGKKFELNEINFEENE